MAGSARLGGGEAGQAGRGAAPPDPVRPAVGIIGVGNMGGGMASNLLARGWTVAVHDVDTHKMAHYKQNGAIASVSASDVATKSEVLIVCVVDAEQTADVLFGPSGVAQAAVISAPEGPAGAQDAVGAHKATPASPLGALRARTVMLCPTIAPADVERFAGQLAKWGIAAIDAPMSGGPDRARDGSMSLMVACPQAVFDQHRLLLQALSSRLFHVSERVGDGARTKLVNNLLAGINLVGAAEVMALADRMGLNLPRTLDVIEQSSGQSWIGSDRMRRAIAGDFEPRAHMTLLAKDTRLAVEAARAAGFEGPLGAAASATFARAVAAGMGGLDDGALLRLVRNQDVVGAHPPNRG